MVNEIDDGADPDDNVVVTNRWGREDLWLYFDTRTGRVLGDKTVEANSVFTVEAFKGGYASGAAIENRGFLKLRITGKWASRAPRECATAALEPRGVPLRAPRFLRGGRA